MEKARVQETLLHRSRDCKELVGESLPVGDEVKRQLWLAGPLIAGSLLQNLIQMISIMFVGHLGELPLAGASVATSFATVTGFSLLVSNISLRCFLIMLHFFYISIGAFVGWKRANLFGCPHWFVHAIPLLAVKEAEFFFF